MAGRGNVAHLGHPIIEAARRMRRNRTASAGAVVCVVLVLLAFLAPLVAPCDPIKQSFPDQLKPPSARHPLGTDEFGRDILSRILYGARLALVVGFVAVSIALVAGVALGVVSGYFGGWVDNVIMRMMDVLLAFPYILLAIGIMAVLGPSLVNVMIAVGIVSVPEYARVARSSVLVVKGEEYIEAARAVGASDRWILTRHVLRNCLGPVIVQATLSVGRAIINAAGLSFLGLGAQPPTPEWGSMLNAGRPYMFDAPWITAFPGIAVLVTVLGFNLLGDGLNETLDPRLRQ